MEFFVENGLTPVVLRGVSQHQVGLLMSSFDALDADPSVIDRDRAVDLSGIGGFLALTSPRAGDLHRMLKQRGVFTDYRGDVLRFGPAPYLSDTQIVGSMAILGESVRGL